MVAEGFPPGAVSADEVALHLDVRREEAPDPITIARDEIARARNRRKRDLHKIITARRSLVDQVLAPPAVSLGPELMPLAPPVASTAWQNYHTL